MHQKVASFFFSFFKLVFSLRGNWSPPRCSVWINRKTQDVSIFEYLDGKQALVCYCVWLMCSTSQTNEVERLWERGLNLSFQFS